MNNSTDSPPEGFIELCQQLGDRLDLVQGAGGNASWKNVDDNTLWVKASGKWLAHAKKEAMFVPVDLKAAQTRATEGEANCADLVKFGHALRPSIETPLHALIGRRYVMHLHPVAIITLTLYVDGQIKVREALDALGCCWLWIDYVKPGNPLALAVSTALDLLPEGDLPQVLILANHGIVFAHDSVVELQKLIDTVIRNLSFPLTNKRTSAFSQTALATPTESRQTISRENLRSWHLAGYILSKSESINCLAINTAALDISRHRWVLYPDHAVFLGPSAVIVDPDQNPNVLLQSEPFQSPSTAPVCILVAGAGVLINEKASEAQHLMLACYAQAVSYLINLPEEIAIDAIQGLNEGQVCALLHWEAEAYRQNINR